MIHHSLTKDRKVVDWEAIRRYHVEERGWKDIGYHFGIELVNKDYRVQIGRSLDENGAHCKGMNTLAIGICIIGNWDKKCPPYKSIMKLKPLIEALQEHHDIPDKHIVFHSQYSKKTCPGKVMDIDMWRFILT